MTLPAIGFPRSPRNGPAARSGRLRGQACPWGEGHLRRNRPPPFPAECGNYRGNLGKAARKPAENLGLWRMRWDSNPR